MVYSIYLKENDIVIAMMKCLFTLVVVFVSVAASAEDAAAKVPVIYQTGQEAFESGILPEPYDKESELAGFKAGYLCDIKGVFWSYFSVKNCKPAAIKGDTYSDEPALVAAIKAKYPESTMKRGIWNQYGWLLLTLLVAIGLLLWIKELVTGKSDD
jgi:hypothetical protein